jgi:hypothetical protein
VPGTKNSIDAVNQEGAIGRLVASGRESNRPAAGHHMITEMV